MPINEPCPTCGATDCKRWQMLDGMWVCDECWLDVASDMFSSRGWKLAASKLKATSNGARGMRADVRGQSCPSAPSPPAGFGASSATSATGESPSTSTTVSTRSNEGAANIGNGSGSMTSKSSSISKRTQDYTTPMFTIGQQLSYRSQPVRPIKTRDARWRAMDARLRQNGRNSCCLLCGRIWWGSSRERCKHCGGMCRIRTDHDLGLMRRHAQTFIEVDK